MRLVYKWGKNIYINIGYNPITRTYESVLVNNEEYEKYKDLLCSEDTTVTKMILKVIQNERHT